LHKTWEINSKKLQNARSYAVIMFPSVSRSNKQSRHTNLAMPDVALQIQSTAPTHKRLTTRSPTAPSQAQSPSANSLLLPLVRNIIDGASEEVG